MGLVDVGLIVVFHDRQDARGKWIFRFGTDTGQG
jgi:hypothetical protein